MTHTPLAPPPRTITDIIAILDQQPRADSQIALRDLADASPPSARVETLADFYRERGLAAGRIGRAKQEIDDLTKASDYFLQTMSPVYRIYFELALAEERGGNFFRHIRYLQKSVTGWNIGANIRLAIGYAAIGDLPGADAALGAALRG